MTLDLNSSRTMGGLLGELIDRAVEAREAKESPREYLGASILGGPCDRAIQYQYFNAPKDRPFSGRILRIFERGNMGEAALTDWLRLAGFDLSTRKDSGSQYGFIAADGDFRGYCDGVFRGGPEEFAPWPRLWECKVLGAKGWGKLSREKLHKAYPHYYAQVQIYMAYLHLDDNPAIFTALNADTQEIYTELVAFDAQEAQRISDRAVNILRACRAGDLLPRAFKSQDFFECKYCDYNVRCWKE